MSSNPYIRRNPSPPETGYRLTVLGMDRVIEVDPQNLSEDEEGCKGSILSILLGAGIDLDHTCGGVCACSTCHIYVEEGGDSAVEPSEEEEDQLDFAPALRPGSRLACQCVPDGSQDVTVELPSWNRNEVSEEPH
jgi:2Fe-2S ferredoxin